MDTLIICTIRGTFSSFFLHSGRRSINYQNLVDGNVTANFCDKKGLDIFTLILLEILHLSAARIIENGWWIGWEIGPIKFDTCISVDHRSKRSFHSTNDRERMAAIFELTVQLYSSSNKAYL